MAEIISKGGKSIRPDMTPMVDLGFLLITFFMYTTTFVQPVIMKYFQPEKDANGCSTSIIKESNTLSLILAKNNRIFWHQSNEKDLNGEKLKETAYSALQLRNLILDRHKNAQDPKNFTVIIKPTDESSYENLVDVLDEMAITKTIHYAVVDVASKENQLLSLNEKP